MKQLSRLLNISLRALLVSLLLSAYASVVLAKEMQPSPEPRFVLPASDLYMSKETTDFSATDKAPLLLAQAASNKAEAAQIAKSRYGGQVLSVRKVGNGWQVKLLLDDGRVKMVFVEGSGGGGE